MSAVQKWKQLEENLKEQQDVLAEAENASRDLVCAMAGILADVLALKKGEPSASWAHLYDHSLKIQNSMNEFVKGLEEAIKLE